jgi:hypothetical protein
VQVTVAVDVAAPPEFVFDLMADARHTHLDAIFDMRPQGPMTLMPPLMARLVRRDFPKQFASFQQLCESRAAG